MCLTFKKNNKQAKKPVNRFLQDDAVAGIQSLKTSIDIKLCQNPWNGLYVHYIIKSLLFLEHLTDLCHSNIVGQLMPSTFSKCKLFTDLPQTLAAEELGKDFRPFYYRL